MPFVFSNCAPHIRIHNRGSIKRSVMATKRPRCPSSETDAAAATPKRVTTETPSHEDPAETSASTPVTSSSEATATQPDAMTPAADAQGSQEACIAPSGMMVLAPLFQPVHESWEAFDEALRAYARATYQLYVIRSTTSVKRRNLKILETAASSNSAGGTRRSGEEAEGAVQLETGTEVVERTLIPERFQWYSKSLKCTHGWKDRHRGTGKRGSGVVRSTSCPAKMCVTLQHRGSGPEEWQVIVTKHVRTHNHQLSKELYLYYSENRRIYDPELLAVGEAPATENTPIDLSNEGEVGQLTSIIDQASHQRAGISRILASSSPANIQNQHYSMSTFTTMTASGSSPPGLDGSVPGSRSSKQLVALSEASSSNFVIRPRSMADTPLATMPPPGAVVLAAGSIPSQAMGDGSFRVPRVSAKVHTSWESFHNYVSEYSFDTGQVFRTRSTVSVAARNAKILAAAAKAGGDTHEIASYASYAAASPTDRLIPEDFKWYSKLLICTYGWKRRSRSKGSHGDSDCEPCPAMLLARMERNIDGEWRVVINRQVQEHNHQLNGNVEGAGRGVNHESVESTNSAEDVLPVQAVATETNRGADTTSFLQPETSVVAPSTGQPPSLMEQREVVVRVPKLQSVFASWDDFHASLKAYSDATYQLYRTRTTSSAKGRNQKIAEMKRAGVNGENDGDHDESSSRLSAAHMIPESWRWYSKTLTCTHGWKERHRGTGKRSAHVVRSTACPVKICATVQYMSPSSRAGSFGHETSDASTEEGSESSCWRVVVTKHIVDHNHNLSRELYQHYCENRRIYDPDLLAIDTSNDAAVIRRKVQRGPEARPASGNAKAQITQPDSGLPTSRPLVLSAQTEAGLAESVNRAQLLGVLGDNRQFGVGLSGENAVQRIASSVATSVGASQQAIPSVVLLPYSSAASYLPSQMQNQTQQQQQQEALIQAAFASNNSGSHARAGPAAGEGVATLAAVAAPGLAAGNILLLNNPTIANTSALPQMGTNVISISCRVHRSLAAANSAGNGSGKSTNITTGGSDGGDAASGQAPQCTCFRIAGGGNYVTIVPAGEHPAPADGNFEAEDESMLYPEDMDGVWQPSSPVEIEHVTTETGDSVWRVPRIARRYPTWEAFHKYLDAYSGATFQLYRVRTTYSVRSRNVRLRQLAASRGLIVRNGVDGDATTADDVGREETHGVSRAHLVPEHYEWYSKTFLCTHGWKRRSRGSGQRVSHNVRATECPAKVCATLQRDGANKWSVVVTKHMTEHNHEISEDVYQQYCEVRRVRDPEVLAQAERLWRDGGTRRRVFDFLKEKSPNHVILMKDVHNLVQRWQSQERRPTQAQLQASQTEQRESSDHEQEDQQQSEQNSSPVVVSAGHDDANFEMAYFQGGDFVELLSAQGKSPAAAWKLQGKISKTFDKGIKGNAFQLDGSSETKMQLPKATSSSLGLAQRFVVLQLLMPFTRSFSVEICFSDFQRVRRRFVVASAFRETTRTALHVQLPLNAANVPRDQWINLVFDLQTLSEVHFPDTGYRSMESICICGSCRLKRIFTMKDAPTPSRGSQEVRHADIRDIPRQFVFSATQRGASGAMPIPTLYFAMVATSGTRALAVTGTSNGVPQKAGRRSQTAPAHSKPPPKGAGARPASGPIARKALELLAPTCVDAKHNKALGPGQQRLRTPTRVKIPSARPQSKLTKAAPLETNTRQIKPSSSAFDAAVSSHELVDNVVGCCELTINDETSCLLSDRMTNVRESLNSQEEASCNAVLTPTDLDNKSVSHEPNPPESEQDIADSVETTSLQRNTTYSPRNMRENAEAQSVDHRQVIMGEIQQKIAILENEDEQADQRSRDMFLRHTSLLSGEFHLQQLQDDDLDQNSTQFSDGEDGRVELSSSWRRELREASKESLISPQSLTKKNDRKASTVNLVKASCSAVKMESFFEFSHTGELGATERPSTKRLFDFESLLQDTKLQSPPLDGKQDGRPFVMTSQYEARTETVDDENDEDDMELTNLLEAKRSARLLHQMELNIARASKVLTNADPLKSTDPVEGVFEKEDDVSKHGEDDDGRVVFSTAYMVPQEDEVPDVAKSSVNEICANVEDVRELSDTLDGQKLCPLDETGSKTIRNGSDIDMDEADNALSIDLTSELISSRGDCIHDLDKLDDFRTSTCPQRPEEQSPDKRSPTSPPQEADNDSDSSFNFEDLVGESESSDDDRDEDTEAIDHSTTAVTLSKLDLQQESKLAAPRKSATDLVSQTSVRSIPRGNQHKDEGALAELPKSLAPVKSPLIESRYSKRDQMPQRRSTRKQNPTPSRSVELSSSFSSRRLQKLLESTDWSAELNAHASAFRISTHRDSSAVRSRNQWKTSSRYRSPLSSNDVQQSTTRRTPESISPSRTPSAASIDLVYDPHLRCYYDPVGNKYYTLAE